MKKTGIILILSMAVLLGLTACTNGKEKEAENPPADETVIDTGETVETEKKSGPDSEAADSKAEAEPEPAQPDPDLDNFDADMEEVAAYAEAVKEAVAAKDLEKLAELTGFPVYVGLEGVDVVETKEAFLKLDPNQVFSEEMLVSIEKADTADLAPGMAGFTLMDYDTEGSPSITFGMVDGELRITGINYGY